MEAYSNSTFIPMSVMLDHLKTPPPGEPQSYPFPFFLFNSILFICIISFFIRFFFFLFSVRNFDNGQVFWYTQLNSPIHILKCP